MTESRILRTACVQLNSRDDMAANLAQAARWVREAAERGAELISLPEYCALMDGRGRVMRAGAFREEAHPALAAFRDLAREVGRTLHVGSLTVTAEDGRPANRGFILLPDGTVAARYDKINMFDLVLPDGREAFESRSFAAGRHPVVAETPLARFGMTICYDLRFPQLFATLAGMGAEVMLIPAAILPATGGEHWHTILRTRAIDTGSFVVGAALCGQHGGDRRSLGHSLIVDPWGRILAEGGEEPGLVMADLDLGMVARMRAANPWLRGNATSGSVSAAAAG
ncbi:carbon-nitrogen hydrolase family protein [Roseomonas elaeocarpi]|uniref:Carbon-nitrogen hydrolase family protein n=1 Tax=Roseomonas elaeocarpi TaxID=907779 RepID=A0ABV6JSW9_9PROT